MIDDSEFMGDEKTLEGEGTLSGKGPNPITTTSLNSDQPSSFCARNLKVYKLPEFNKLVSRVNSYLC